MNIAEQFKDAIASAGMTPPAEIYADGKLRRFASSGKRGDDAGWYVLHDDGIPAGVFGDWRNGVTQNWRAETKRTYTPEQEAAHRARIEVIRKEREQEERQRKEQARQQAEEIWKRSPPADVHPYLTTKGIKANGTKLYHGPLVINGMRCEGALLIPMRDVNGDMQSLEFVGPDGEKRFLAGGGYAGCYFGIGRPDQALCIVEGYATGASVQEATGYAVAVAFTAGNLVPVAKALRQRFPDIKLIICADNDVGAGTNTGVGAASKAAELVGGALAIPQLDGEKCDFNDLYRQRGTEAVKAMIAEALKTPSGGPKAHAPALSLIRGAEIYPGAAKVDLEALPIDSGNPDASKPNEHDRGCRITYRCASDIQARPIHWLWHGRIARGKVSMLAGNPGLGKSQVAASMAATVTTGGTWPVDRTRCEKGSVVILSAEDDPADTIRPRLEAVGADLSRVFILDAVIEGHQSDGDAMYRSFNLVEDMARLGDLLAKIGDVALIVIDPITAYLGGADSHKNAEIRALLAPLSDLAAKHGAAVVCVSHLNKGGSNDALMRVTGSLAFVAASRAAFVVAKDQDNDARRLLLPLKNNIGNDQTGLAFSIHPAQVDSAAGLIDTSSVVWEPDAVTVTADEAMAPQGDMEERDVMRDAREFLRGLLADGPVRSKQIKQDAEGAGYSWRTIQRAQKAIGIEAIKESMNGGWVWQLPYVPIPEDRQDTPKTATQNGWQSSHSSGDVGGLRGD